jgi:hypothetical protein
VNLNAGDIAAGKAMLDFDVAVLYPSERLESLSKGGNAGLCFGIVLGEPMQEYDAPHPLRLLRARRNRPCDRRAAEKRDELAPPHVSGPRPRSSIAMQGL